MAKQDASKEFNKIPIKNISVEKEEKLTKRNKLVKAVQHLNKTYDFILNKDTQEVEFKLKEEKRYHLIDDQMYRYMKVDLDMNELSMSDDSFRNLIYSGYFFESYHPFKDYLKNLPIWDGQRDYLTEWCQQIYLSGEKKYRDYLNEGFKKWFVALVMSLLEDEPHPYNINQTCLVFTGKQGKFKSTFFSNLVPKDLRLRYYMTGIYDFHKEEHQKYLGTKIIINLEELAGFNRSDIESIKTRITQHQAGMRLAYGKADSMFKRRASFVATTNDPQFLNDYSGSRRFFTVPVDRICIDDTLNVDNIYAQALALYKKGYQHWFDEDDIATIEVMNEDFQIATMEEEMILSHFRKPLEDDFMFPGRVCYMDGNGIAKYLTKIYERLNVNNSVIRNLGRALSKNGFEKANKRINGKPAHPWAVIPVETPVITEMAKDNDNNSNTDVI